MKISKKNLHGARILSTMVLIIFTMATLNAQIKKPIIKKPRVTEINLTMGIVTPNCIDLSTSSLIKMKVPKVQVARSKKSASASTSWEITPVRPKIRGFSIGSWYYGEYSLKTWTLISQPRIEGQNFTGWFSSWLFLQFKQTAGTEYRMKIKLLDNRSFLRGKFLYVSAEGLTGRYPIDHKDNTVNVVWKAKSSGFTPSLQIGPIEGSNPNPNNPSPKTRIQKITIDRI